jgi:hypothetical protein
MATPTYKGQSQPAATNSGWLGSWFGGSTPAYLGTTAAVNPPSRPRSFLAIAAPAYKLAPAPTDPCGDVSMPAEIAIVIPRGVIDPQT